MIKFTDEFNDLFIKRHSQGVGPSMIFRDCGYDLNVIGSKRVVNYYNRLQRTYRYKTLITQTHLNENNNDAKKDYKTLPPSKAVEAKQTIDDWMDYYNNERYQWDLAKLSPAQFYEYYTTGIYPLEKQGAVAK